VKILEIVERMKTLRTITVGDTMIDKYIFCAATRLCPEGPIPVLVPQKTDIRNGGAGHTSDQLRELCSASWQFFGTPPSTKTRYMVGQRLVARVDEDHICTLSDAQKIEGLGKHFKENARYDVIVISDYAKGLLSEIFCKWLVSYGATNQIPVVVDPKGKAWDKYAGCTLICPNIHELKLWEGTTPFPFMLLKCGENGLSLYQPSGQRDLPARAKHVYDVTGAGDTVTAVAAATLGAGGTMVQAATLSNLAAGWSVGEVGTVVCTRDKLIELVKEAGAEHVE
jgi:bifunctional ADP-heptose synthase (sugar kinase/adenylyltransferase)